MIPTSNAYKQQLIAGNRNYLIKVNMTLADGTTLLLTNENIWEQGIVLDEAVSSDNSFDIGSAIVGSLKVVIDNISGYYSPYDFYDAKLVLYLGVTGDLDEHDEQVYYRIGFYVVDTPSYNGSLITLDCLDNMTWFDAPFSEVGGVSFPTTAGQLVADICSHVGVTLGTPHFQNYTTSIPVEAGDWLSENDINCREVLQYVAQMCCCYCKINTAGELVLTWFDKSQIIGLTNYDGGSYSTNTTPYSDGDNVNGGRYYWNGSQYVWEQGDNVDGGTFTSLQEGAWLTNNFEMQVSTDDIVVTGCRVRSTSGDDQYDELWVDTTLELTHERYVLVIENNPLIIASEAPSIANLIGSILAGLPIRAFTATSLSDFSIESGDMVRITDFRGNIYYTWITHFTFTTNNSENFSCGAESVRQRSETRFSEVAKTLAEAKQNANKMLSDYDNAVKAMNELAQDAIGYNIYQYEIGGSTVTWLYSGSSISTTDPEHPTFPNSANVFKISGDGVFISNDGGVTYTQGYDANSGTAILSLIYAIGINCDWIKAGTLTLGGYDDKNGVCSVLDAGNPSATPPVDPAEVVKLDKNGIKISKGEFNINGNFIVTTNGSVQVTGGMFSQIGSGYLHLAQNRNAYCWQFDIGERYCNCMYSDGSWHWVNGGATAIYKYLEGAYNVSDKRYKKDIVYLDAEQTKTLIMNVEPCSFKYTYDDSKTNFGMLAQDVKEVLDEIGIDDKNGLVYVPQDDSEEQWSIEYKQFVPHLIKMVQMQQEEIDLLKQEVAELKARVK